MKETKAMKYNLKNKLRNLACVSLLTGGMWGLSACSDYLDVVPDNVGTIEHSFSNRNEAEKYLFTCYSYIPEYHSERANVGLMGGDELATFYPIQSGDDYATWRIGLGYQNVNDPYMNYWDGGNGAAHSLYEGLRDCNTFLTYVSDLNYVGDLAPSMRKRWLAEVKFLKAYYHYLLLRMYGPIVIINENLPISSTPEEVRLKRAPVDKVVAFISDLLDEAKTDLPVLGVPVKSSILNGVDSLLSIVQMPAGIAVGTLAIGPAGATNAAIMAAQILGLTRPEIAKNVADFRAAQTDKVASKNIPGQA